MAVTPALFLFEVVVESVKSLVESRSFVIRSDFADIFSLELKDPKQMNIVIPEPPPLPPEPPGKKGKKKAKPKKGKKGKVQAPPPEPVIQAGQSVLFSSTAEFLIQTMKKFPLEISLWSNEELFVHIGTTFIPWDLNFLIYLQKICNCEEAPPYTLNEEYNVFQEGLAKLMAKIGLQIKLSYLTDTLTTSFRTMSEDPEVTKLLYTGINSKVTSFMCNMKINESNYDENLNKIENNYLKEQPKIAYANYKNAETANVEFFKEGDYCCMGKADKPPLSNYKAPEKSPDIDFIIEYVRTIISSCYDKMRMLTPRPILAPRIKATDIDKLCYCQKTDWPKGPLAEHFKKKVQSEPCATCYIAGKKLKEARDNIFDIANIKGPCGRPDCKIAQHMKNYIEDLMEEDRREVNINDIVGPCGSRICTVAEKIKEILRHEGEFTGPATSQGLSTQCGCINTLQEVLIKKKTCIPTCSEDCQDADSDTSICDGKDCPFKPEPKKEKVYNVYYFTVEHYFDHSGSESSRDSKYKYCSSDCASAKAEAKVICSRSSCSTCKIPSKPTETSVCQQRVCDNLHVLDLSPADSNMVIHFDNIKNPCTVEACDVAEKVKDLIADGVMSKKHDTKKEDHCFCDCICDINFSYRTTFCSICGGYECLGEDVKAMPEFRKPHPCPVYHKLYDKTRLKVESPWPEETETKQPESKPSSVKSGRMSSRAGTFRTDTSIERKKTINESEKRGSRKEAKHKAEHHHAKKEAKTHEKKQVGKFTATVEAPIPQELPKQKRKNKYRYPPVPANMGWNWKAEDIPAMKPRPQWRPGAVNKMLLRKYRAATMGVDLIAKKKRAMLQKKKKFEVKPTLVVTKLHGEYQVQMEVFKVYSKERLLYQNPYAEKPPLIYTIGKTDIEKHKIQQKLERKERRETRRKSRLIQSTFRDRCQEICLKAYNQAIGLLPTPDPNNPECPCNTAALQNITPPLDSCSCSEDGGVSSSDTDDDEWTIEFSPPAARWDAKARHPPIYTDNESQYTYLDYKVKLLDKWNNPVVRYFKGPDGKQECSDLGGFWGPGHVWLEINKDGYVGIDNRWVPNNFFGPDGHQYQSDEGVFTTIDGRTLKIGVDGYVDKDSKWVWYSRGRSLKSFNSTTATNKASNVPVRGRPGQQTTPAAKDKQSKSPVANAKSGDDKKQGAKDSPGSKSKVQKTVSYASGKGKSTIMYTTVNNQRCKTSEFSKPNPNLRMANKYKEIMEELALCDEINEYKPLATNNRASNTPRLKRMY